MGGDWICSAVIRQLMVPNSEAVTLGCTEIALIMNDANSPPGARLHTHARTRGAAPSCEQLTQRGQRLGASGASSLLT
jgi:hypothetical protein